MNFFTKNRFVVWLLIFLIIVNVSALVTFMIFFHGRTTQQVASPTRSARQSFMQKLSLTPEQDKLVRKINNDYRIAALPVSDSIKGIRMDLLDELSKESPDPAKLKQIKDELCILQTRLQDININQFLSLKKICTRDQTKSLSGFYEKLYGCDSTCGRLRPGRSPCNEAGKGMQHRHRGG
jgi:hypothetical protein